MLNGFWKVLLYFIIVMGGVVGLAALFAATMDLGNAIDDLKQDVYNLRHTVRTTVETWRDPENENVNALSTKEKKLIKYRLLFWTLCVSWVFIITGITTMAVNYKALK
jgi:hypothetical protein